MTDLETTAYHEAAHAVVAIVLGVSFERVFIGAGYGELLFSGSAASWTAAEYRAAAVTSLAGTWGELHATGRSKGTSRSDLRVASAYARAYRAELAQLSGEARLLVGRNWPSVRMIASELVCSRALCATTVRQLLRK